MFYTIYKTTNIINGKFYIGKHKTKDLNDGYIGSGQLLKRAVKKYGIDNFHKEILHICESEKQMNTLEKILVVPDVETNYNLCPGGHGGWGYINQFITSEEMSRRGKIGGNKFVERLRIEGRLKSQKPKQIKQKAQRIAWNKGKPRDEETRKKISQTLSSRYPPKVYVQSERLRNQEKRETDKYSILNRYETGENSKHLAYEYGWKTDKGLITFLSSKFPNRKKFGRHERKTRNFTPPF